MNYLVSSLRSYAVLQGLLPAKTFAFSARLSITWFIMFILSTVGVEAQLGTTPYIKHIVVGRCFTYSAIVNPRLRYDCEEIWTHFEEAVIHRPSCNVTVEHYNQMFHLMPQIWPCDKFLFWSKTRALMHSYAAVFRHFWTLEDTLAGYMFNDLVWCGQDEDSGFDFQFCPEWAACMNHPVYSLWRQASKTFAEMACGNVTVLLNGSIVNAFNRKSMFGSVELDSMNPQRVDHVNIKVVTNLAGPQIESCNQGSIVDLIQILQSRGFRWTCTDSDQYVTFIIWSVLCAMKAVRLTRCVCVCRTLRILQCVQDPTHPSCQLCPDNRSQQRSLVSD
ncbi:ADP-ribosyl cyclase/cyclic ADP-ribose hydrolase 1-like isoform 2-T2 [Menidia menidia]